MTVKSVIDVDINDAAFKKFQALFDKYQAALAKTPGDWGKVNAAVSGTALTVETLVAGLSAQAEAVRRAELEQKRADDAAKKRAREQYDYAHRWERRLQLGAHYASNVARSMVTATAAVVRWTAPLTLLGGLVGGAGLFGLDRLALDTGAGRRASQGLGLRTGEQRSFETNYGRLIDASGFLSGVNNALTDPTQSGSLYGAGLTSRDIDGKDTGQVAAALIPRLKALVDQTPDRLLGTLTRRFPALNLSVEDLRRLKVTSSSELAGIGARYDRDRGTFDLQDATQRKWQDLGVSLSEAKTNVESALVRGLVPLTPQLEKLSGSVAKAIDTFLSSPKLKVWIEDFGRGIGTVAAYLGSDKFQRDIREFVTDIDFAAHKLASVARFLGLLPDKPYDPAAPENVADPRNPGFKSAYGMGGSKEQKGDYYVHNIQGWLGMGPGRNNPGNLRNWTGLGFQNFDTPEKGIRAIGKQLQRYEFSKKWGGLDTISKIIATYAPAKDHNDVGAYIKDVVARTGFGANQHLDLHDTTTLAKLIAAITKHENKKNNYTPGQVVKILNNTGGSAVVSTASLAH